MMLRLVRDREGTVALEFALLAPVLIALMLGALGLGVAFWQKNILQAAALESARCIALASPLCMKPTSGCASTPGVCYAISVARDRGLASLKPAHVTLNQAANVSSKTFTAVKINYPYAFLGYKFNLSASASYPNKG